MIRAPSLDCKRIGNIRFLTRERTIFQSTIRSLSSMTAVDCRCCGGRKLLMSPLLSIVVLMIVRDLLLKSCLVNRWHRLNLFISSENYRGCLYEEKERIRNRPQFLYVFKLIKFYAGPNKTAVCVFLPSPQNLNLLKISCAFWNTIRLS